MTGAGLHYPRSDAGVVVAHVAVRVVSTTAAASSSSPQMKHTHQLMRWFAFMGLGWAGSVILSHCHPPHSTTIIIALLLPVGSGSRRRRCRCESNGGAARRRVQNTSFRFIEVLRCETTRQSAPFRIFDVLKCETTRSDTSFHGGLWGRLRRSGVPLGYGASVGPFAARFGACRGRGASLAPREHRVHVN
jgi:hypothetical protein